MTQPAMHGWYLALTAPPGTPPPWLFGPVWTVLYILMGIAAWQVWRQGGPRRPLLLWGWQLLINAAWNPIFFGLHGIGAALVVILLLVTLVAATAVAFLARNRFAGMLLFPYLLWSCYATYLNAGFWWLNPG